MSFAALREAIRDLKSGQCHPSTDCHCALCQLDELEGTDRELRAQVARLTQTHSEEVGEFNAGYEAARAGKLVDDEPSDTKHDQWCCGYAWGAFDGLLSQVSRLSRELERLHEQIRLMSEAGLHCWLSISHAAACPAYNAQLSTPPAAPTRAQEWDGVMARAHPVPEAQECKHWHEGISDHGICGCCGQNVLVEKLAPRAEDSNGAEVCICYYDKYNSECPAHGRRRAKPAPRAEELNSCGRMHEECAGCALEEVKPPRCAGHVQGPIACPSFRPKPAPRGEAELTPEASREVREAQSNSDKEVLKIWTGGKPAKVTVSVEGCPICAGPLTAIRGRLPGDPERIVCATCLQERMDNLHEQSGKDYGRAYEAGQHRQEKEEKRD